VVRVVPVVSIVAWGGAYSDEWSSFPALSANRISAEDTAVLIDDDWTGVAPHSSWPGYAPKQVTGGWENKPSCSNDLTCVSDFVAEMRSTGDLGGGRFYRPDRMFDQCNIQFREIAHYKCEVPPELLHPFQKNVECGVPESPNELSKLTSYINKKCLRRERIPGEVVKVVFSGYTHRLGHCQESAGVHDNGWIAIAPNARKETVSHELGHSVSLNHLSGSDVCSIPGNLMCTQPEFNVIHTLEPWQCDLAYVTATNKHNAFW
jgi:hypothetical protein